MWRHQKPSLSLSLHHPGCVSGNFQTGTSTENPPPQRKLLAVHRSTTRIDPSSGARSCKHSPAVNVRSPIVVLPFASAMQETSELCLNQQRPPPPPPSSHPKCDRTYVQSIPELHPSTNRLDARPPSDEPAVSHGLFCISESRLPLSEFSVAVIPVSATNNAASTFARAMVCEWMTDASTSVDPKALGSRCCSSRQDTEMVGENWDLKRLALLCSFSSPPKHDTLTFRTAHLEMSCYANGHRR